MPPTESNCTSALHTAPVPGLNSVELIHVECRFIRINNSCGNLRGAIRAAVALFVSCIKHRDSLAANLIKCNTGVCFTMNECRRRMQAKLGNCPRQVWGQKLGQALLIWVGTLSAWPSTSRYNNFILSTCGFCTKHYTRQMDLQNNTRCS